MDTETTLNILQDKKVKRLEAELAIEKENLLRAAGEIGRLSALVDELLTERADINRKYLELVAMISYYTEDNKGLPYCRDIRGEVAKTAQLALDAIKPTTEGQATE